MMLRLKDCRSRAKGQPDLLPYAALIAPGVALCKDGGLLAAWEFRGQDTASSTPEELAFVSAQFNNAVKLLGTGWMLHIDALRSSERAYSPPEASNFPDQTTRLIDDERRRFFSGDACFSTRTVLTASYKPGPHSGRLAGVTQSGSVVRNELEKNLDYFQRSLLELEDALSAVLRLERLQEYEEEGEDGKPVRFSLLLSHLQHCLTGIEQPVKTPETPMYLDALLGGEDLVGGLTPRIGEQSIAVLSIDGFGGPWSPAAASTGPPLPATPERPALGWDFITSELLGLGVLIIAGLLLKSPL
jgi:type IV secretion system protein VirB4